MRIDNRLLALLMAATLGTTVIGCQREGTEPRAGNESTQAPLAAAPSNQGPAGIDSQSGPASGRESGQAAAPMDQGASDQKAKEPGDATQSQYPTQR